MRLKQNTRQRAAKALWWLFLSVSCWPPASAQQLPEQHPAPQAQGPNPQAQPLPPARSSDQYDKPVLSVRVSPASPYVQQAVTQSVSLVSLHPFETLQLDMPEVEGTRAVTLIKPRNKRYSTYGFEGYLYETARVLFATQSGELTIPPITITGSVKRNKSTPPEPFSRTTEPTRLQVSAVPDTFNANEWLVADELSITQEYSKPLSELRRGDTVQRTITLSARGVTGEHLPELKVRNTRNIAPLPGPLTRQTRNTPEAVFGSVSRSFQIRIDSGELIDFAPVAVPWWDTKSDTRQMALAAAARIEPLPRDVAGLVTGLMTQARETQQNSHRNLLASAAAAVLAGMLLAIPLLAKLLGTGNTHDRKLRRTIASKPGAVCAIAALIEWQRACYPERSHKSPIDHMQAMADGKNRGRIAAIADATFSKHNDSKSDFDSVQRDLVFVADSLITARQNTQRSAPQQRNLYARMIDTLLGKPVQLPDFGSDKW